MGTRVCVNGFGVSLQDHPHAYGDKNIRFRKSAVQIGSSPRVWGQASRVGITLHNRRIIPTRMGTRHGEKRMSSTRGDHPHAYGDKYANTNRATNKEGSSPRVWGQGGNKYLTDTEFRIIPTRMGTSYPKCKKITDY